MNNIISSYELGDMSVYYVQDAVTGAVGFEVIPAELKDLRVNKERTSVDPCVHLKLVGDAYPNGFSHGRTMRNADTVRQFAYAGQTAEEDDAGLRIITLFRDEDRSAEIRHWLIWRKGCAALESITAIDNQGPEALSLEMLTSFSIGGLTPFAGDDGYGRLQLHRLRSTWSMEGRHEAIRVEDLQLEPSWQHYSANSLRFGQIGSMPVRGFFPFAAIEDKSAGAIWGVQLACPGSWQLEVYRRDNGLCLSGGLADREFGHWLKEIAPGSSFVAPSAFLTAVRGGIDEVSERLVSVQELSLCRVPALEDELPVVFNEFCTTWGSPSADRVMDIADRLEGHGIGYLVIDCGWYSEEGKSWERSMGDWVPNPALFPNGIGAVANYIHSKGMIPGIWFEIEICGEDSAAFHFSDHLLKRDGHPITTGIRRFWDMRDPWTVKYLKERVIDFIRDNGFGYLKIDYNDSIGIGCEGTESLGEGLRAQMAAAQSFIRLIHEELPGLVIENCSSGGHRLEPSFMSLTSMSSFSDAHEEQEISIIAANLHRAILPRQSQIWAVIRGEDTPRRIVFSITSTFLGRMCLSGDLERLSDNQWKLIDDGIAFYRQAVPIIKNGTTRRFGPEVMSYRNPEGWQSVVRTHRDGESVLVVTHTFGGELPETICIPLPGEYVIAASYGDERIEVVIADGQLLIPVSGNFQASAHLLKRIAAQHEGDE
ncbi:Alpha-galactosidase [compost metagenome]